MEETENALWEVVEVEAELDEDATPRLGKRRWFVVVSTQDGGESVSGGALRRGIW